MREPEKPAPPKDAKRPLSDAEFFGIAPMKKETVKQRDDQPRPDWHQEWIGENGLKKDFVLGYDSRLAYQIFTLCEFQWLHGFNGITGMNYAGVAPVLTAHAKRQSEQSALWADIHLLELGAMTAFNEQRRLADEKAEADRKK